MHTPAWGFLSEGDSATRTAATGMAFRAAGEVVRGEEVKEVLEKA